MAENWVTQSASDLGRGIEAGEIDPVDLTEAFIDNISASPFKDRIYARTTIDRARAEATAAAHRQASGNRCSLLDGVPISWKDLFDTAGVATESGSALLKGRTPKQDGLAVARGTAAGLVCLGKSHMSEFAFSGLGVNPVTETPPCVNDHEAAPGGSSSGAAASVAFGLAAAGIGSDTGGSVRIPSAWNDLVGLKTTSGLIPLDGTVPLCARFDTIGPLCRTVEDCARLNAILASSADRTPNAADPSSLRFMVLKTAALDDLDEAVAKSFERALERLSEAGAEITEVDAPEVAEALPLSPCLYTTEAYGRWKEVIEENPGLMYPEILERFRAGAKFSGVEFVQAWDQLLELRQIWHARVAEYDAVLAPTAPILPPNVARLSTDSDYYVRANLLALRNTRIGNLLGLCGISLPTATPSTGLMAFGSPFGEQRLLSLGLAIEKIVRN